MSPFYIGGGYTLRSRKSSKYLRAVLVLTVFLLIIGAIQFFGIQPITGYAVLEQDVNTSQNTLTQKALELKVSPDSIELEAYKNQTISSKIILENSGTIFLNANFTSWGSIKYFLEPTEDIRINPSSKEEVEIKFDTTDTWMGEHTGAINVNSAAGKTEIPVRINVLENNTGSNIGGGGSENIREPSTEQNFQYYPEENLSQNSTLIIGAVYYNRSFPKSNSYELVPVPYAEILAINETVFTNQQGIFELYLPNTEDNVDIYAIGSGFLVDKNAYNIVGPGKNQYLQFILNIGKAKTAPHNHTRFVIGQTSEIMATTLVSEQDTVLEGFEGLHNVKLEIGLIKEVNEEIYDLSKTNKIIMDMNEGTQYIKTNLTLFDNLPSRDLYLPELQLKLLTSTNDIIDEHRSYTNIGFLVVEPNLTESGPDLGSLIIYNPTNRNIEGVLLVSELESEFGEILNLDFSENNFEIPSKSFREVEVSASQENPGHYSGSITVSGTLPPVAGWDEYASDMISVPVKTTVPGHNIGAHISTPIVGEIGSLDIDVVLKNYGEYPEEVTLYAEVDSKSVGNTTVWLEINETKKISMELDTSNFTPGIHNITINASIQDDYYPADNSQSAEIYLAENPEPKNLVLVVLDGAGWEYFAQETTPHTLELSHRGFFSDQSRVWIPSTTQSHSILFTSRYEPEYDWKALTHLVALENSTIMDSANNSDYLVLGVLGQGDAQEVVDKMDAILHDEDNNWENFDSDLTVNSEIPPDLNSTLIAHNNLSEYQGTGDSIYIDYNQWTTDSISGILKNLAENHTDEHFIILSNFAGTDHGGHEGPDYYFPTLKAADTQVDEILQTLLETGLIENTVLVITADHGMCFRVGSYGEYGYHASCAKEEAYRIPFIAVGPSIKPNPTESPNYNDDTIVTICELLNLPKPSKSTGNTMQEFFKKITDVGISSVETDNLLVGENATLQIELKNYGDFESSNELCLEISDYYDYSYNKCKYTELEPKETELKNFNWKIPASASYKLTAYLTESDDNPDDKLYTLETSIGLVNDLAVGNSWYTETDKFYDNKTRKVNLTVEVCNFGSFKEEDNLKMHIWLENCTETWCNKTYNPKFKVSPGNCNQYKKNMPFGLHVGEFQNINFQILNYSSFNFDSNPENNIKTMTTYLSKN